MKNLNVSNIKSNITKFQKFFNKSIGFMEKDNRENARQHMSISISFLSEIERELSEKVKTTSTEIVEIRYINNELDNSEEHF